MDRLKKDRSTMFYSESLLNVNQNTPLAALSAMTPVQTFTEAIEEQLKNDFRVLRPGQHQDLCYDLTLQSPYDIVSLYIVLESRSLFLFVDFKAEDTFGQVSVYRGKENVSKILDNYLASYRTHLTKR